MIYLFTENFLLKVQAKNFVKKIFNKKAAGPEMVFKGLCEGLDELGVKYSVNVIPESGSHTACVVNGAETLAWALEQKTRGKFSKILAGPNIAMPADYGGIIFDKRIDALLVPCAWAADFCASYNPSFAAKIKIWAAGVKTFKAESKPKSFRKKCFIYYKNKNTGLLRRVCQELALKEVSYTVIEYGKYTHEKYFQALSESDFGVFLTDSESQGLAIHEAWMMNVPTLVWAGGHMVYKSYEWKASSSAPYLVPSCGMFFSSTQGFGDSLNSFLKGLQEFSPKSYHLENFTLKVCAQKYLDIIKSI